MLRFGLRAVSSLMFLEGEGRVGKGWLSVLIHSQFKINASDFLRGGED